MSRLAHELLVARKGSDVCSWSDDCFRDTLKCFVPTVTGNVRQEYGVMWCAVLCLSNSVQIAESTEQFKGTATFHL